MQYYPAKLMILIFFLFSNALLASQNGPYPASQTHQNIPSSDVIKIRYKNYTSKSLIIVDMGSSGTRMHAFTIKKSLKQPHNAVPNITEVALAKSSDGLAVASFEKNPQDIGKHIAPIYQKLKTELADNNIDINTTPIYFLATAGMRLISQDKQDQIHSALIDVLTSQGHKDEIIAKTIPGSLEGIFDWLSVNYKLGTLQNKKPTVAALDMGGASTQVAMEYAYNKYSNIDDVYTITFAGHKYHIYSKSILGYGLHQTKKNITKFNANQLESQCSINKHSSTISNLLVNKKDKFTIINQQDITNQSNKDTANHEIIDFNFKSCTNLIKSYLKNKKEHLAITKAIKKALKNKMKLMAVSGYYYNFKFFNSNSPEELLKKIPDTCHSHRSEFKKMFPDISEEELNETCFNATYLRILLNHGYDIPENYSNFIIPKHDIDWTIGAAVFIATDQKWL